MSYARWDALGTALTGLSFRAESWWDPELVQAPASGGSIESGAGEALSEVEFLGIGASVAEGVGEAEIISELSAAGASLNEAAGLCESLSAFEGIGAGIAEALAELSASSAFDGIGASIAEALAELSISSAFDAVGEFEAVQAPQQAYSGGWYFGYDRELHRRREEQAERLRLEEESKSIDDLVSRDIALLLRRQEAQDAKAKELKRLHELASTLKAREAKMLYGERVSHALQRAIAKGNHSALEALDRELQRSMEEEEWLLLAATIILDD